MSTYKEVNVTDNDYITSSSSYYFIIQLIFISSVIASIILKLKSCISLIYLQKLRSLTEQFWCILLENINNLSDMFATPLKLAKGGWPRLFWLPNFMFTFFVCAKCCYLLLIYESSLIGSSLDETYNDFVTPSAIVAN